MYLNTVGRIKFGPQKFRTKIKIRDFSVGIFGQKVIFDVEIFGQKLSQDEVILLLIKFKTIIFRYF